MRTRHNIVYFTSTLTAILSIAIALMASSVFANMAYKAHDLGLGRAYSVNDAGQACGYVTESNGRKTPCVWINGEVQRVVDTSYTDGTAIGINNSGKILIQATNNAVYWNHGDSTIIRPSAYNTLFTGTGINDNSEVCGYQFRYSYTWSNGSFEMLESISTGISFDCALAINNVGQVCGHTYSGAWPTTHLGFLFSNGHSINLSALTGKPISTANDLNDFGAVVGVFSSPTLYEHAFMLSNGELADIGTLGGLVSKAYGINNNYQVVGWAQTVSNRSCAFIWQDGIIEALDSIPGALTSGAVSISDTGWIAGYAVDADKNYHAILWEPVPEPSSILAMICGISGLGGLVLQRMK